MNNLEYHWNYFYFWSDGSTFPMLSWKVNLSLTYTSFSCSGLLIFPEGPLNPDQDPKNMSEMFRPFQTLLFKIR